MTLPWKARLCSSQNFGLCSIGATLLRMWEGEGEPLPLLPIPPQQAPTLTRLWVQIFSGMEEDPDLEDKSRAGPPRGQWIWRI